MPRTELDRATRGLDFRLGGDLAIREEDGQIVARTLVRSLRQLELQSAAVIRSHAAECALDFGAKARAWGRAFEALGEPCCPRS